MAFARADLLLRARVGIDDDTFAEALIAAVASGPADASIAVRLARLASLADSASSAAPTTSATPVATAQANSAASRFDAVISAGSANASLDQLASVLIELGRRLAPLVDVAASGAIVGTVEVMVPGDGPTFTLYPLRRITSMPAADFRDYWRTHHGDLARRLPGLSGYRQLHADPGQTASLAAALGYGVSDFDGCAEGRRPCAEAVALPLGPELEAILADEKTFIDLSRCGPSLYQAVAGWRTSADDG